MAMFSICVFYHVSAKITMFHDSIPIVTFFWYVFNPSWKILVFTRAFHANRFSFIVPRENSVKPREKMSFLPEFFEQSTAFFCQTVFLRGTTWRIRLGQFDESRFNQRSHDAISQFSKVTMLNEGCDFS